MRVKRADLGQPIELAEGGFGKVYRVPGYHLPGDSSALVYKEFTKSHADQARSADAAVSFRTTLRQADREDLDRCTAWPRAVVEDKGAVIGLLMPLIPDEFFCAQVDPDTGGTIRKPLEMQWLIASDEQRTAARIDLRPPDKTERLILLGRLVYAIGRLHRHGWVFGDISFKNAVFALDPPRVLLLDCDGAAPLTDRQRKQGHTPFWEPPECVATAGIPYGDLQDKETDVYKLGLAILRCLSPGKGAATSPSPARVAGELDAQGLALVTRAVDISPSKRPTAKELYAYLASTVAPRVKPPVVLDARLITPMRVRGMDARVEWHIEHATEVAIAVGNAAPQMVSAAAVPQSYSFRPQDSGPVAIEVANRYGRVRVDLGDITLYELPPFNVSVDYLPRLEAPTLNAFTLNTLHPLLASVPRVPVPEVPLVPALPTSDLISVFRKTLIPDSAVRLQLPQLGDVVTQAAQEVAEMISSDARQFAESRRQGTQGPQAPLAPLVSQVNMENDG